MEIICTNTAAKFPPSMKFPRSTRALHALYRGGGRRRRSGLAAAPAIAPLARCDGLDGAIDTLRTLDLPNSVNPAQAGSVAGSRHATACGRRGIISPYARSGCFPAHYAGSAKQQSTWLKARTHCRMERIMIVLGIILLIIGFVANIAIVWTIGIVVLVIGLILALLGGIGHTVGPRRHYW